MLDNNLSKTLSFFMTKFTQDFVVWILTFSPVIIKFLAEFRDFHNEKQNLFLLRLFESIGSQSLKWCKQVDVKLYDLFLLIQSHERNLRYLPTMLSSEF